MNQSKFIIEDGECIDNKCTVLTCQNYDILLSFFHLPGASNKKWNEYVLATL